MTLAEKGLPHSGSVGNELYDKLGSLGLTSFMQEVTRVRAIEGELARTIQMMRGVKAARVHIVMADEGSFRRERQPPSASVIIRTDGVDDRMVGEAIRHLVAAAVPGMKADEVTVLNVDGRLLASGSDIRWRSRPTICSACEKEVSQDMREKITTTLAPYLSLRNFQVSVAARLNADKTQTNETIYDPDQRAERSVRVDQGEAELAERRRRSRRPASNANLPKTQQRSRRRPNNRTTRRTRSEELTNYEISSKPVTTTSAGFDRQGPVGRRAGQSRRARCAPSATSRRPTRSTSRSRRSSSSSSTAAGLRKERGDTIKVSVVDFVDADPRSRAGRRAVATWRSRCASPAPTSVGGALVLAAGLADLVRPEAGDEGAARAPVRADAGGPREVSAATRRDGDRVARARRLAPGGGAQLPDRGQRRTRRISRVVAGA